MSRLQLLITQYREDENIIKLMLNSIQAQINIDLINDIEVIIGNDGSDVKLSKEFLSQYTFPIQYHFFEHSGIAGCRKHLYDISTAEYILFCDGDDMFISNIAFSLIFKEMENPFDCLSCGVYREVKNDNGAIEYKHYNEFDGDIHALVFRRQFLQENKIEWHNELHESQANPYVTLAKILAKERRILNTDIYLWKYYPDSITWKNGNMHRLYTWPHKIDALDALVSDLLLRGMGNYSKLYAYLCLYATYYLLHRAIWHKSENSQYKFNTYKRIAEFYRKYQLLLMNTNDELIQKANNMTIKSYSKDVEQTINFPSIEEWMQSILNLF